MKNDENLRDCEEVRIPRLMFAAPKSGSGKTLAACGFLEVLKRRGLCPRAYKCGPDYIDPMFHKYVLGVPGGNLDSFFLSGEELKREFSDSFFAEEDPGKPAQIAVLEGVMGYYDGLGGIRTEASSYEVSALTDTPVVLVLDCKGASLSLAAEAGGFLSFRSDHRICGLILNRLSSMLYGRLGPEIERETGIPVLGFLPEKKEFFIESRHLGLTLPGETGELRRTIDALAGQMEETVLVDRLISLAKEAPPLRRARGGDGGEAVPSYPAIRIGVARDEAFCFYYQENLRLMERMGAELVCFSPMHDRELPGGIDGLLLGGGYPEIHAGELSGNNSMLRSLRAAVRDGMPFLAECGGFLYLHESLTGSDGAVYPMAGVVAEQAYRTERLNRFGYVLLTAPDGTQIKGHEFHYWESSNPGKDWLAEKPAGGRSWRCMYENGAQICGFPHLYYPSSPGFLAGWLKACRLWSRKAGSGENGRGAKAQADERAGAAGHEPERKQQPE